MVRLGKFTPDELDNVVGLLFPTKSAAERKDLLTQLLEGYEAPKEKARPTLLVLSSLQLILSIDVYWVCKK